MAGDSIFDLVPKTWEEYNWQGMPGFKHQDLEPKRSILVHFANDADVIAFSKLIEQKFTTKTKSIWYPQAEIGHFADKVYVAENAPAPRYPIYIISKGRWESRLTAKSLEKIGVAYHIVVEPQEYDDYARVINPAKILTLPFSNLGQGSIPARNWVWDHAQEAGAARHWILDDNIDGFFYYQDNLKTPVGDGTTFAAIEDYVDQYENVALAGMQYFMFVSRKSGSINPITLNTRIYSCILIDNSRPYRWRGRYNEDTDLSLRILKDGLCTILFNAFLAMKQTTMTMKGGNTDELYQEDGRLQMAESLQQQHPDLVTVTTKWGRYQHHVNYKYFQYNRLVLKADAKTPDLDILSLKTNPKPQVIEPTTPVIIAPRPRATFIPNLPKRDNWTDPFMELHASTLKAADGDQLRFDDDSWDHSSRSAVGIDVETFYNFFVICFKRFSDGKRLAFELSRRSPAIDRERLTKVLKSNLLITFNGLGYDVPMIRLALREADNHALKELSDQIISGVRPNERPTTALDHIDLIESNPSVKQGLKTLNGRLHGRFMVDLPFNPDTMLTSEQMNIVTLYCFNDIDATELLYTAMREPLELRAALSKEYNIDLRSKSDAQIGEAIVKKRVGNVGRSVADPRFRYEIPSFIHFDDDYLNSILDKLASSDFTVNDASKIEPPDFLKDLTITIGASTYKMGIGGLHSSEAHRALHSNDTHILIDVDVASQYPRIISKLGIYPKAMGPAFLDVYRKIIDERLAAKSRQQEVEAQIKIETNDQLKAEYTRCKVKAEGGKIQANGIFGKLGSSYSPLYSPKLLIAVTLTGQLSILMLISSAETAGIAVVSANTDGVVFYCPREKEDTLATMISEWEQETGFTIEKTQYKSLYSSSVNSYIAIAENGKVKRKGPIADPWKDGDLRGQMSKNPQMTVCSEAVLQLVSNGISIEETIRACTDPRAFITIIKVTGGALWRGHKLGRVVRYYWSTDGEAILSEASRKVAKTDGAKPMLEITNTLPGDLDYPRYYTEAHKLASELGIYSMEGKL